MHFDLPEPLGRVALGICMDMNPKDFICKLTLGTADDSTL
jgi:hypothetical protein